MDSFISKEEPFRVTASKRLEEPVERYKVTSSPSSGVSLLALIDKPSISGSTTLCSSTGVGVEVEGAGVDVDGVTEDVSGVTLVVGGTTLVVGVGAVVVGVLDVVGAVTLVVGLLVPLSEELEPGLELQAPRDKAIASIATKVNFLFIIVFPFFH